MIQTSALLGGLTFVRGLYTRRWRAIIVVERLWMSVKKMNGNDELIEK